MCNPGNVREVAEAKPDFMGFIFYPESKRYVGKSADERLFSNVPARIIKTGVFVNENPEKIMKFIRRFRLDAIQLHGSEPPDYCNFYKSKGLITLKAFGIGNDFDFDMLIPYLKSCDYFLFDTMTKNYGGSGIRFDWSKLDEYQLDKEFFLSGGIGYEDIHDLRTFNHKGFYAVDINSRFESSTGIKDSERIKTFIKEINM